MYTYNCCTHAYLFIYLLCLYIFYFYGCMYILYVPINRLVADIWRFINFSNNDNNTSGAADGLSVCRVGLLGR